MNTQLATMSLPIGSLDSYIARVNQLPMLSATEETAFAKQFQDDGDLDAARQLVLAHLRYVVRVAKGYAGYGLPLGDLIQEGNLGLMKAVKRFDPSVGVRLVSFAVHWIKAEIHEFILKNWRIVKVATTKAQRKLFFNLRQMKKRLGWFNDEEIQAVADDLGVSTQEDPALLLEVKDSEQHAQQGLLLAMRSLDTRSQEIIQSRWLSEKKATLHELADRYQVSAERIRQLEAAAMKKLKSHIQDFAA